MNKTVHYHDFVDVISLRQSPSIESLFKKLNFKSKVDYLLPIDKFSNNFDRKLILDCLENIKKQMEVFYSLS